ncbi:hypothetical protein GW846_02010 [Candidatus Gracilibacteria bacterium]|nr:hypothetical protein [Candidatus Gracilibacteria bacterium]
MFKRLLKYEVLKDGAFYDRDTYENIFHDPDSRLGKKLNTFIVICVILSVGVLIIETVQGLPYSWYLNLFFADALVSIIFLLEYLYRFLRSKSKLLFPFKAFNIIDLLSFAPFFLMFFFPALSGLAILKVLRLLRIMRLFEVSAHSPIALGFLKTIREYHKEYKAIFSIFMSLLIIISSFVYYVEFPVNPTFSSIPQSLWWGFVTMSTVGYGDMVPVTAIGKVFGVLLILLGPVLLAVISSITILVFMDVAESQKITDSKICRTCKTRNSEHANFCLNCGEQHFTDIISPEHIRTPLKGFMKKLFGR